MSLDLSRQELLVSADISRRKLNIIGAGGIGSNTAWMAASLGFTQINIWDFDKVGEENIAPQFYALGDVGFPKVTALAENIATYTGVTVSAHNEKYTRQHIVDADIVLVGTDDMPSRRRIWKQHDFEGVRWWLDGRMGATTFHLFTIDMQNERQRLYYEQELLAWETQELLCGQKATSYMTKGIIPGLIGNNLAYIVNGHTRPDFWLTFEASIPYLNRLSDVPSEWQSK